MKVKMKVNFHKLLMLDFVTSSSERKRLMDVESGKFIGSIFDGVEMSFETFLILLSSGMVQFV